MKKAKIFQWGALFLLTAIYLTALSLSVVADGETNLCQGIAAPTLNVAATSGGTDEEKAAQMATQAAALIDGVYANGNSNSSWALRADYYYSETNPPTATFDLGAAKKVGKWVITGASSYTAMVPSNFDIQYSPDGTNWQTAAEVRGNTDFTSTTTFANIEAQYWRLVIRFASKTSGEWSRITEIEMYEGEDAVEGGGDDGGDETETDKTTNWCFNIVPVLDKASTSGATDEEKAAQRALQAAALVNGKVEHGNTNTSWALRADYHKPQATATFDLGSARKIGKWVVTGASAYASIFPVNYDICFSTDGVTWQTAAEVRGNNNFENTTLFSNVTAQYWKMIVYFNTNAATELYRISEIEMYGGENVVEIIEKPEVTVVEPANLTQLYEGETLSLSAQATCETAEIESVGFYANGTLIASAAVDGTDGLWKANADNITAGEYVLTAKAVTVKGGEAESESVRVRVHSENYTNIALGKKVTASPAKSAEANPDALVDGVNNITTGEYRWYANASQANGAYAEIDLDCGFGDMFLLRSIKLYSGYTSGTEYMSDFTLYYHNGETWIEAVAVSGNTQVTYTYVFPSEVKASAVKLVSAQSAVFRVRELEVLGKLDDTKLSKTATVVTDDAGDEIKILQQDMVVRAEAEITNADTEENGNVDVLALLAVKDSNDKLLSANALSKTVGIGTTEAFELTATIPEGNEVYCEVFWFDAHTLAPLFPKNTIKSKVQKYSSDEVVVSVTSEGFDVYIKGSDIYGTDYVQYPFKHVKNKSINADLYRIFNAYAVERTGDTTFVKTISAPLLSTGELEFAVRELVNGASAADFIGGYHGDENLTSVSLKVDGVEIDLNSTGFYKGATIEFVQNSIINKCDQPNAIAANHTKSYTIDKDGVKLDQTVDWVDSIILDDCYPCMFPVYRTDGVTQVTDFVTYEIDGQEVIYDTRDNQAYYMTPTADIFAATIYSASNGYSASVKYIPGEGLENHKFFFQVRPVGDTKVYFGSNKGNTTAKGEHWEWTNLYKLDLN